MQAGAKGYVKRMSRTLVVKDVEGHTDSASLMESALLRTLVEAEVKRNFGNIKNAEGETTE
jgi:hypothetical protein